MTETALRELQERVGCPVEFDRPLAPYTTYRIGGPARAVVNARSRDDVVAALDFAAQSETRWLALGLGSNVLISDRGFDGIVVRLARGLGSIERGIDGDETVWRIGAGVPTPILARRTAKAGLAGVHRLVGVPGTVGGGVYMNAGAHGQDFGGVVRSIELVDGNLQVRTVTGHEVEWRYRGSGLRGVIVLGATLALTPADPGELQEEIRRHLRWRKAGTPFNKACCGSVFRNPAPPAHPAAPPSLPPPAAETAGTAETGGRAEAAQAAQWTAGRLIDACGLKGFRVGGAEVSQKHANYIVNVGGATASDVLEVIDAVREKVKTEFGVELELEVETID